MKKCRAHKLPMNHYRFAELHLLSQSNCLWTVIHSVICLNLTKPTYFLPSFVYKQKPLRFIGSLDKLETSMFVVLCYGFKNGFLVLD